MRCWDGLPQQVWHQTSVLARSPFTVRLKTSRLNCGIDHRIDNVAHREQMDLRLLELDHRAARIGEVVQFLVERVS